MRIDLFRSALALIAASFLAASTDALAANRAVQILTPQLAQKLLGSTPKASISNSQVDTQIGSTWVSNANYTNEAGKSVGLMIRHGTSKEQSQTTFDASKKIFKGVNVAGLGDAAFRTEKPAQLDVLKGANWLIITVGSAKEADKTGQENLAKDVLPKINF